MSKPKRKYKRPPYKKMWLAMNDENEGLRLEVTNLRKENKSLKMDVEMLSKRASSTFTGSIGAIEGYNFDPHFMQNISKVTDGNGTPCNPYSPLYDQPKPRTWWERLWGLT